MIRKWIVYLKRRPQSIPLALLVVCCFLYTFNLSVHSNATMYVSSRIIALFVFAITLSSMLTIFSFVNAYSRKHRRNWFMHGIVYALILLQIGLDTAYWRIMYFELYLRENPVPLTADIARSMNGTMIHMVALSVTLAVAVLVPVYGKLLMKVNTSVEDDEDIAYGAEQLDLEDEV